jgi:NhaA family Na+:H+ antiporter
MGIRHIWIYLAGGILMWYLMLHSGVHATLSGVMLAFAIPFGDGGKKSPSYQMQHFLHMPVAFFILPLFAMANTSLVLDNNWYTGMLDAVSVGIMAGLVLGKPLGVLFFSFLGVKLGLSSLPSDLRWKDILGVVFLAGIGFTMSIFITLLAFDQSEVINTSKMAILIASLISGILGFTFLRYHLKARWAED